jgi:4-amino-4-deoxy-L-arabinose transferase-like glycosyltransferase
VPAWLRFLAVPVLLHIALCVGVFQYGLSSTEMQRLHIAGPSRLIEPYLRALHVFGPLGVIRTYLRGEQDEKLYLEYSKLLLLGRADMKYIAERQNDPHMDLSVPARAWPYRDVRVEYPPLAFLATLPPALITTDYRHYRYAFAGYMLALQLLNLWLATKLLRAPISAERVGPQMQRTLYLSLGFLAALGLVVVTRMDHLVLTSTLLILWAFERAQRSDNKQRERLAWAAACGAFTALGVMIKLVPGLAGFAAAVLWLSSGARDRWRCVGACLLAGAAVLLAANLGMYALAGERYLQTFQYHSLRGVQIESLYAGLLMCLRPLGLSLRVEESFGSTNLASVATPVIKPLSLALFAVVAGFICLRRRYSCDGRGALLLTCALLLAFMLTNRVFSPQYLIWVGAALCAWAAEESPNLRAFLLFLSAVWLSQLIFPRGYPVLKALHPLAAVVLNVRNVSLVVFSVWLIRRTSKARGRTRAFAPSIC